jgi:TolA-binding protein
MLKKGLLTSSLWLCLVAMLYSQSLYTQNNGIDILNRANEQLTHHQYLQAQQNYITYLANKNNQSAAITHVDAATAQFGIAWCAAKLNQPNAEDVLKNFALQYPSSLLTNNALYAIGAINYEKNQYQDVITYMEPLQLDKLDKNEVINAKFYLAYSYFFTKKLDKAKPLFLQLASSNNKYFYQSNYYSGYIAFNNKEYGLAENHLLKAAENKSFQTVVPYYLCQIYFNQKKYELLLSYGTQQLKLNYLMYKSDIENIIGQTYVRKKDYTAALPYLENAMKQNKRLSEGDLYQLAFVQYQNKKYVDAIQNLKDLNVVKDSLGQLALYMLGDCYLKTNEKNNARAAFSEAAVLKGDKEVEENAKFNSAKLAYELGMHQLAINELNAFIFKYDRTTKKEEAKEVLGNLYLTTNNYKDALQVLQTLDNKSPKTQKALQKVAFSRAIELINDKQISDAISLLQLSLKYPIDNNLVAGAHFWMGEIEYNKKNYLQAISAYNRFIEVAAVSNNLPENVNLNFANYNLGYCHLKMQQYAKAISYFKTCGLKAMQKGKLATDAELRIADSYFTMKQYDNALDGYNMVINNATTGADYALYQSAIIQGLVSDDKEKITRLTTLVEKYPKSIYADDGLYEKANTHFNNEKFADAESAYQQLISNYSKSTYYKKAYLKLALVYINANDNDKAISTYQTIISQFPNSQEATEAVQGLKLAYIDKGDASSFLNFVKLNPNTALSATAEDSLIYLSADANFAADKCEKATEDFTIYLNKFPNGFFATQAIFQRAECYYKLNKMNAALIDYEKLVTINASKYIERSLAKAAYINYNINNNAARALNYFVQLSEIASYKSYLIDAQLGAMRCGYKTNKEAICITYCNKVMENENASDENVKEANFYLGKIEMDKNNYSEATNYFKKSILKNKNEQAAEAKFLLAQMLYNSKEWDKAEKACFDLINQIPSYDKWVYESLLLLSDVYLNQKEYFQAKATLETLIDNCKTKEYLSKAKLKKEKIDVLEKENSKIETPNTEKIDTIK